MTLKDAAVRLDLSPETLRIQIAKGKLRAERHGRDWWVTPSEVERYRAQSLGRHQRTPRVR